MLVHRRVPPPPSIKLADTCTHLYTRVERDTVRVKCLAQEHNTMSRARTTGPLDPESSALTMRSPRFPAYTNALYHFFVLYILTLSHFLCRGVNMYAMLTGKLPYTAEPFHITTLYNKMKRNEMNPIPDHLSSCKLIFVTRLSVSVFT